MIARYAVLTGVALILSGCSGMKTEFDCKATASDSCLTMQQADDKAREIDGNTANSTGMQRGSVAGAARGRYKLPSLIDLSRSLTPIRVAPAYASASVIPTRTLSYPSATAATSYPAPVSSSAGSPPLIFERTTAAETVGHSAALNAVATPAACLDCTPRQPAPQREIESVVRLWIAPYIDSVDAVHMPGEVFFVKKPATWRARYEP